MIIVTTIVRFIFVAVCVWPDLLSLALSLLGRESFSSRLTTSGPASPQFEIWIKPGPWKHRPIAVTSRRSSLHQIDKVLRLRWAAATGDSHHPHGARGRRIDRVEPFFSLGRSGLRFKFIMPLYFTTIGGQASFFQEHFSVSFFLVNVVPLLLTEKGT